MQLVGCMYYCISYARSYKHETGKSKAKKSPNNVNLSKLPNKLQSSDVAKLGMYSYYAAIGINEARFANFISREYAECAWIKSVVSR